MADLEAEWSDSRWVTYRLKSWRCGITGDDLSADAPPVGRRVDVVFTDPWDFVTEIGDRPVVGVIRAFEEANDAVLRLMVEFEHPLTYKGEHYVMVNASPRHSSAPSSSAFLAGSTLTANMSATLVRVDPKHHGLFLIGDIRIRSD
ncbi:MAG TPA: hypothetical protein VHM88_25355 [Candidatus Acidoferrales bacterium]|nr:hypothetical protein [Candidatus Acidoferrales bacterium]